MSHPPILVKHALGSYPVYVEAGILARLDALILLHLPDRRVALIADERVWQLGLTGRLGSFSWRGDTLTVPAGEASKSRDTWAQLSDTLLERQFGRDSGLIGLGGGVVGDLTGFVAATYMRGIPYLLLPTTLLAMVDASVGGKTAVNTSQGKNLVGAFHPPAAVIADPNTLTTLPEREFRSGLAEAVKHGFIVDESYLQWIESQAALILQRDPETLVHLVRRSVEIKAEVVGEDERESGRRAILNAGHTVAHALEAASGYQLSHGEAVALGLIAESVLAERLHVAVPGVSARLTAVLRRLELPVRLPRGLDHNTVLARMSRDKKNRGGEVHCALIQTVGRMHRSAGWSTAVPLPEVAAALGAID
jgi:3-dehydroquinate synthase